MDICVAEIELCRPVCLEPHKENPTLGKVALREGDRYIGLGVVESIESYEEDNSVKAESAQTAKTGA